MNVVGENSIFCDLKYGGFTKKDKINLVKEIIGKGPHESGKKNYC